MSDQSPAPEITERMKCVLQEVRKHAFPVKEKTFFSIEGIIGHLENPTTELLRFFMAPNGGHDLGPLFLRAFFTCLKIDCSTPSFDRVKVWPQVQTDNGKFIDLLIEDSDWVLLIENKIRAPIDNPLQSYEDYANRYFPRKKTHLTILSRDEQIDPELPQWKAVSYQNYCKALKNELTMTVFDHPISKWQVFAREFIVHLENTLYNPAMTMTKVQIDFVEANLQEIRNLKKLSDCYTADLLRELSERLTSELQTRLPFQFSDRDWALLGEGNIGQVRVELLFQTPAHGLSDAKRDFVISAWVGKLTEPQRQRAAELLKRPPSPVPEQGGHWVGELRFKSRPDAINALCTLAKELFDLWGNGAPASPA